MNNAIAIKNTILAGGAFIISALCQGWHGLGALMQLLVVLMAADYVTGVLVATVWHKSNKSESGTLDSKAGFKGLVKKGVIIVLVYVGILLDRALGVDYVKNAFVLFFCGNEGLSLLENIGLMGVKYPAQLQTMLEALRTEGDKNDRKTTPQ